MAGHNALLVGLLAAMAAIHAVEAWGLWHGRRWASWLVVVGASLLLPLEAAAVWQHASAARLGLLAANLLIVGWLVRGLVQEAMSTPLPTRRPLRA